MSIYRGPKCKDCGAWANSRCRNKERMQALSRRTGYYNDSAFAYHNDRASGCLYFQEKTKPVETILGPVRQGELFYFQK